MKKYLTIVFILCCGLYSQASAKGAVGGGISNSFIGLGAFASYSFLYGSVGVTANMPGWQIGIIGLDNELVLSFTG